jgi:hypothetical protein
MSDRQYREKSEEKEEEKKEEKSPEEKGWDEKWRRDPINAATWALIFIWAGIALLLHNLGILDQVAGQFFRIPGRETFTLETWSVIFIGAGFIVLIEVLVRLFVPAYRRAVAGSVFLAIVLIGVGLGNIFGWNIIGPVILIALGLSVLLRGLFRR